MLEIFVSHAHEDHQVAQALVTALNMGAGVEIKEIRCTSFAPAGLGAGSQIANDLRKDIRSCKYFMPLITKNVPGSEFVLFEIGAAWVLNKKLFPVVHRMKPGQQIPSVLSGLLYTNLGREDDVVKLLSTLTADIFHAADQIKAPQILAAARSLLRDVRSNGRR